MGRLVIALAVLTVGCSSSSSSYTCCYDNTGSGGTLTFWDCPNQTAFNQCCGNGDLTPVNCGSNVTPANTCTETSGTTCSVD